MGPIHRSVGSFPSTLRSLKLCDIPLYPPFFKHGTLTKVSLQYCTIHTPLDTLLDFLEENRSLESVVLDIDFDEFPTPDSRHRVVTMDQLQLLSITFWNATVGRTLISSIPLQRGAHLRIVLRGDNTRLGLNDILSGFSTTHLPNLPSPTCMRYRSFPRKVRLIGQNGTFSYHRERRLGAPFTGFLGTSFVEFPMLPLADIRELRLTHNDPSIVFRPLSFPALETLTIKHNTDVSPLFSALFPDPSFFPLLKTLEFSDCVITEALMGELTRFASGRKNTTSARLRRVVIIGHRSGTYPTFTSIRRLNEHVPIVDLRYGV